jgi:RNA polymerase sigma factor (sigma-70 family)
VDIAGLWYDCIPATGATMMAEERTTDAVQRYLNELTGDAPVQPVVRALLDRAIRRLRLLCTNLLHRNYPRLQQPPLNLQPDELLGAVIERVLKAMRVARPTNVRQFFSLANKHILWELNDLVRRLDKQPHSVELHESIIPAEADAPWAITPEYSRIVEAIGRLPDDEREVFELARIQGLTHAEVAGVIGVSVKTVQRRLNRSLQLLAEQLGDLKPDEDSTGAR